MISLNSVNVILSSKEILKDITMEVKEGEVFSILGPSGCGKSVLLQNIIGLMKPNKGEIIIDNIDITKCNKKELNQIRKKCGFLFQHSALFDSMTIEENLAFPVLQHTNLSYDIIKEKINEKLKIVGLNGINDKKPSELSGGMQKRAALARSIILEPKYMFYDEPTTGLDPIMSNVINDLIIDLNKRLNITSIVVTHDMKSAFKVSDRLGLLYNGEIIVQGDKEYMKKIDDPYFLQFIEGETNGPIDLNFIKR
ncbi:ABC transporter ATP-binding protein [Haliovirga abyssi]|uniref:ABC transporter ATP-binding protein n=1 Tax=Haliovirga abyssi TaxID=2996794 RepID=A0AAU9DVQ4_9FUSO|nr:ABC transporter ATP-binding protein [Haliovirga abyssi]BDU50311.1 ABC transporter ATP-binding protein [Haliovirga abyssi]